MFSAITGAIRDILFSNLRAALLHCAGNVSGDRMRRIVTRSIVEISYSLKWIDSHPSSKGFLSGPDVLFGALVRKLCGSSKRTCRASPCTQERKAEDHA